MVYGYTDYYLKVHKFDYVTYFGPTVSVEEEIVRHYLQLGTAYSGGGSSVVEEPKPTENKTDLSTNIGPDRSRYQEGDEIIFTISYRNKSETRVEDVRMYSKEEREKAIKLYIKYDKSVKLYIKYDKSAATVIRELGYPDRSTLVKWYKEYLETGVLFEPYAHGNLNIH